MDLDFFDSYSITACRIDCETRYLVENCNCRMVHMPGEAPGPSARHAPQPAVPPPAPCAGQPPANRRVRPVGLSSPRIQHSLSPIVLASLTSTPGWTHRDW